MWSEFAGGLTMTTTTHVQRRAVSGASIVWGGVRGLWNRPSPGAGMPDVVWTRPNIQIAPDAVADYARLCGFRTVQGVPMTYPHILGFSLQLRIILSRGFPFPAAGLVHLGNRIRQHYPLGVDDHLTLTARPGHMVAHDKGQAFTLCMAAERDGRLVWESESLYLHRRGEPGYGNAWTPPEAPKQAAPLATLIADTDIGRRYARLSGDSNPIHTSRLGARIFGFPAPIAHGMWTKARVIAALAPDRPISRAEVEVAFRAPLVLPDTGQVSAGPDRGAKSFAVTSGREGRVVMTGRAVFDADEI